MAFLLVLAALVAGSLDVDAAMIILAGLGLGGGWSSGKFSESRAKVKTGG